MQDVLIVEATEELQNLATELGRSGLRTTPCTADEAAARLKSGERIDAVLLNVMDGPVLAADQLAALHERGPVIALIRTDQIETAARDIAIDDFAVHPARGEEIAARIARALARRDGDGNGDVIHCGDLMIDQSSYKVFVGTRPVELTYKEYELLRFLAQNEGKVSSRETLLNRVWGYDFYGGARTVDVHIRRLRSKIEDPHHNFIETVRNVGYRFHAQ